MRPIYHRTDRRAQAHIYVAALAFLLHRAIEKKLKAARLDLSAAEALNALKSVRVVDIDLGDGTTKRSVTRGTQRAAAVLRALRITALDPPDADAVQVRSRAYRTTAQKDLRFSESALARHLNDSTDRERALRRAIRLRRNCKRLRREAPARLTRNAQRPRGYEILQFHTPGKCLRTSPLPTNCDSTL